MEKIIDIKKLEGARSLGSDFNNYILGDIIEESLEKLKDAVNINGSNNQYGYTFNNIFIDGSRGSGKTTVLLTLRDILSNRDELQKYGLQDKKFIIIDSLLDTSVNKESITFYFLSWLKKEIEEKYQTNHDLMEQLYKTIKLFPSKSEKIDDIEEKLDRSDLSFRNELFKLIDGYLNNSCSQDFSSKSNSFIVLFLDDLDISFPVERIQEILTEIFLFLSHPNVIVIGAGDYNNLVKMLTKYVSKEIGEDSNENGTFHVNISKSYLEKTFATHLIRLNKLTFEQIKNIKIRDDSRNLTTLNEFLEKNIEIVKILGFDSSIFRILFNHLTIRELILILKEVSFLSEKRKPSKNGSNEYVINYCFSHILKKYLNIDLEIGFDSRFLTKLRDKNKNSEFEYIAKRIQKTILDLNKNNENLFFEENRHSLITLSLELDNESKKAALFWLWFYENMLFMDGLKIDLYKIFLIDLIFSIEKSFDDRDSKDKDNKNISTVSFIKAWGKLDYEISELKNLFEGYDHYLKLERYISIHINKEDNREQVLSYLLEDLIIKKGEGENEYFHLLAILDYISKFHYNSLKISSLFKENQYQIFLIIDNLKDKIIKELTKSEKYIHRFFYLLLFYFNFLYKIFLLEGNNTNFFSKSIHFQYIFNILLRGRYFLIESTINWWNEQNYRKSEEQNKKNEEQKEIDNKLKQLKDIINLICKTVEEADCEGFKNALNLKDLEKIYYFLNKHKEKLKKEIFLTYEEFFVLIIVVITGAFIEKILDERLSPKLEKFSIVRNFSNISKNNIALLFYSSIKNLILNKNKYSQNKNFQELKGLKEKIEEVIKQSEEIKKEDLKNLFVTLKKILEKIEKWEINRNEN